MKVLVTGGAGYIGSHTIVELFAAGHEVVVADNLVNSSRRAIDRLEKLAGRSLEFYEIDVCDSETLRPVFDAHHFDAVIHFAGLKAVGESVAQPLRYYRNNLDSTLTLCELMAEYDTPKLVFSSSATVYGDPAKTPITEDMPTCATNPYGWTKYMNEQIIRDFVAATPGHAAVLLRYFNPVGAHESGEIGEDPRGIPNNLVPFVAQVAVGRRDKLKVFGGDYPTPDGTGVRDYIHVVDLAKAHVKALEADTTVPVSIYNIGTGSGRSVLEVVKAFEKASGKKIAYEVVARRPGDIAACFADPSLAERELGWRAEKTLDDMCADTWRWQSNNPNGYGVDE